MHLDGLIDQFAHALAPVGTAPDAQTASKLLLVHTLACVASNQLHKRFRQGDAPVANKDYAAAISVTAALDALAPAQVGFVNPIFAVRRGLVTSGPHADWRTSGQILWTSVSRALIAEMVRLRGAWASASIQTMSSTVDELQIFETEHSRVVAALAKITAVMTALSGKCPLMGKCPIMLACTVADVCAMQGRRWQKLNKWSHRLASKPCCADTRIGTSDAN